MDDKYVADMKNRFDNVIIDLFVRITGQWS
jgi:hypothetical protein